MGCFCSKPAKPAANLTADELALLGARAAHLPLRSATAEELGPAVATYVLQVRSPTDPTVTEKYLLHVHKRSRLRAAAAARRERAADRSASRRPS